MDLKRTCLTAFLITLGIMLGGTLINYLYFQSHGYLLFASRMWGGEITRETGFGWVYTHIYSMTPEDRDSISLRFSIPNFILWFFLIFAVSFLAVFLVSKFTAKRTPAAKNT
ncbi:MAG: hypothetical protein IKD66_08770 [Solobacterium sp.]|nr:hypothetical protein [Solobacterium sp.]